MNKAQEYIPFLVALHSHRVQSPAEKNELVYTLSSQIRGWNDDVMIHESLKELARLTDVPEQLVLSGSHSTPNLYLQKTGRIGEEKVNPNLVLESDFLRWLLMMGDKLPQLIFWAKQNISTKDLEHAPCRQIYTLYMQAQEESGVCDWMSLAMNMDSEAQQLLADLHQKKVNKDKAEECFEVTIKKILDRNWIARREQVRVKIQSGECSEKEVLQLLKQFDELKKHPPTVKKESDV